MKMRTEKQIYDTILNFAKADDRIRVVTLEGSRTNINIIPDDFQDYDITFFVTDMQSFINSDEWLNVFGERLIMQKPEDMELFPKEEKGYSRWSKDKEIKKLSKIKLINFFDIFNFLFN